MAVAAVAGAIVLGNHMAEPTVVADPYEEGLRYDETRAGAAGAGAATASEAATSPAHAHAHDTASVGLRAPPRCDLGRGPCAQRVGGATVTLALSPRPLRTMSELAVAVEVSPASAASDGQGAVAFAMPGMEMGDNRARLALAGPGRWQGKGVLVRCPSGRKRWAAEVEVPAAAGAAPLRAAFLFDVVE